MNTHKSQLPKSVNRSFTRALLIAAAATWAVGAAGCMVSIEAEIPSVEVTQKDLSFAGVPMGGVLGDVSMTQTFSQEHDALELPDGLTSEVKALEVTLTATKGVSDFGFVHYLRLTMSDDNNNANAVELINYERADNAAPSNVLKMIAANPVNALEKWKTKSAVFTVEVAGTLPEQDWAADITVRFGGKIHYQR